MTDTLRQSISKMRLGTVSAALTLGVVLALGAVAIQSAQGQTFTVLHKFNGYNGAFPYAGLVPDVAGNLYGTTYHGGSFGGGTVFKVNSKTGKMSVLHNFAGASDGNSPYAGLLRDAAGSLYGTTILGGASGQGTVFKLDTRGVVTLLHNSAGGTTGRMLPQRRLASG